MHNASQISNKGRILNVYVLQKTFLQCCCRTKMAFADHVLQESQVDSALSLLKGKMYGQERHKWMWTDDNESK